MATNQQTKNTGFLQRAYHRTFTLGAMRPHVDTLLPYFDSPGGKFVEIGARDGIKDSITPYLEKGLGWEGILVEPWPHLYQLCRKRRKSSISLNVAAAEKLLQDSYIEIVGLPPKASVRLKLLQEARERIEGKPLVPPPPSTSKPAKKKVHYVSTNSVTGILDRANFESNFELMAFNLIGYEDKVLEGMDFEKYRPTFLLFRTVEQNVSLPNLPPYYQKIVSSKHNDKTTYHLFRFSDFGVN